MFIATGDSFITRRLPQPASEAFDQLSALIRNGDIRFTNLEVITPGPDAPPSAFSGGTWARADKRVIDDLKKYGFNCMNTATNHVLDYLYEGLYATEQALKEADIVYAGVGENLHAASAPKYVEADHSRIALIGATTTFHESWMAGHQRKDSPGRPGVNGMRVQSTYKVAPERLELLKETADRVGLNHQRNLDIKEGFLPEDENNRVHFGSYVFEKGNVEASSRTIHKEDISRMVKSIHEAKRQADYVLVSLHTHEMEGDRKEVPANFVREAAHRFIDEGADAVIGHGPHILRGIEIYEGKPIFYSLGNFIFQNDTVQQLPADFYEKYGLSYEHNVADALDHRSRNGTIGLGTNPLVWESVVAEWTMSEGQLTQLVLHPIELGFNLPRYRKGWPKLTNESSPLLRLRDLSEPFGTKMEIVDGKAIVQIPT